MWYVYVLYSESHRRLYIGSSETPDERLAAHNAGRGGWSARFLPWKRLYLEEHCTRDAAMKRERYLKSGWGRRWLARHVLPPALQSPIPL